MNELDRLLLPIARTLDLTTKRLEAVAQNLANVNVPGYRRVDVDYDKFVEAARRAADRQETDELEHYRPSIQVDRDAPVGLDGNSVQLEEEVVALHKIMLRHELATQLASSKFASLRRAITGQA